MGRAPRHVEERRADVLADRDAKVVAAGLSFLLAGLQLGFGGMFYWTFRETGRVEDILAQKTVVAGNAFQDFIDTQLAGLTDQLAARKDVVTQRLAKMREDQAEAKIANAFRADSEAQALAKFGRRVSVCRQAICE